MTWPVQFRDETSARWPWMAQTLPSDHHGFSPFHFVGCSGTAFTCKERWGRSSTLSHIPQHHQAYLLFYMSLSKGALLYTLQLDNKINKLTQPPSRIMNQIIISSRLSPAGLAFPSSQSQPLHKKTSTPTMLEVVILLMISNWGPPWNIFWIESGEITRGIYHPKPLFTFFTNSIDIQQL